ncbi:MAG: exodeoxyribonuclease VII large subunit [Vulcanimicrobiaceae bacterium]
MNGGERRVVGVSELARYIKRMLSESKVLATIRVRGEISGLSEGKGGIYFDLKEQSDILKCVAWSEVAASLPPLRNGSEAIIDGVFGTWPVRSQYQVSVTAVELGGLGNLYAQVEELRRTFRIEGLFEPGRKRTMPVFPRSVALVSARGKGAEDFLTTMARRAPHIRIRVVETRVQGEGAQIDIAQALDAASRLDVDAIVLARGGGSYEDLFPFNLEPVVRAIVRSKHPVLTAIGHTDDHHLADDVADRVAETPSNAANYFGELRDRLLARIERIEHVLGQRVRDISRASVQRFDSANDALLRSASHLVAARTQRVLVLERRLDAQTPLARLAQRGHGLGQCAARLETAVRTHLNDAKRRLEVRLAHLEGQDPHAPLARGYAMVFAGDTLLRDASSVREGDEITARLERGTLAARVEGTREDG